MISHFYCKILRIFIGKEWVPFNYKNAKIYHPCDLVHLQFVHNYLCFSSNYSTSVQVDICQRHWQQLLRHSSKVFSKWAKGLPLYIRYGSVSFPVEKRVSRLFRNLGAIVVVYVTCVWWRLAHQEICRFTFYRLGSVTESVLWTV